MAPQDQAELWMALRDRMKADWHDLTWQEKKIGRFQVDLFNGAGALDAGWPGSF